MIPIIKETDIVFSTPQDAENFMTNLSVKLEKNGYISLKNIYDLAICFCKIDYPKSSDEYLSNYGFFSLERFFICKSLDMIKYGNIKTQRFVYILSMPEPVFIN